MYETKERQADNKLTVDIKGLCAILSCGECTARRVGEKSGAKVTIGKRVIYIVKKVEKYLEELAG